MAFGSSVANGCTVGETTGAALGATVGAAVAEASGTVVAGTTGTWVGDVDAAALQPAIAPASARSTPIWAIMRDMDVCSLVYRAR